MGSFSASAAIPGYGGTSNERATQTRRPHRRFRTVCTVFDDGPAKPVRIWSRIGRRPILACGNSNGDVPMLEFSGEQSRRTLQLLVLHDDGKREFDYTTGAEIALARAKAQGWTVISMRNDWARVFGDEGKRHTSS